jgi:hypothetical protein
MATMAECIHGFEEASCGDCAARVIAARNSTGTMAGKSFALVFVPRLNEFTFLHLNREGDHWKFRWYESPSRPAIEVAQSGQATTRNHVTLSDLEFIHEIAYPYSTSVGGVSVKDSRYWFDEISQQNAKYAIPPRVRR